MMIIKIEANANGQHLFQSQSHRQSCWLDGYIAVPQELKGAVFGCMGYCELTIENNVLIDVIPHPEWIPETSIPEHESELTTNDMAMAILEGVNEV